MIKYCVRIWSYVRRWRKGDWWSGVPLRCKRLSPWSYAMVCNTWECDHIDVEGFTRTLCDSTNVLGIESTCKCVRIYWIPERNGFLKLLQLILNCLLISTNIYIKTMRHFTKCVLKDTVFILDLNKVIVLL